VVWQRDLHREAGLAGGRIRLRLGGARVHERYRGAYWSGTIRVTGAVVRDFSAYGLDHPEQTVWRQDATTIAFRTSTSGDTDSIELDLSTLAGARIEVYRASTAISRSAIRCSRRPMSMRRKPCCRWPEKNCWPPAASSKSCRERN
jgi:hypothetical protein